MKIATIATLSLAACLGIAYAGAPEGKPIFTAKCQACHGPNGEGKASIAKMFNVTMLPLGSKEIQAKSDADIKKVITEGHGKMKPVGGLDDKQIADAIAFVRTLKE
ncbi:MAG TPA: cytochrome c [Bryobacteraceae bacterium]|nr:cytochrome c [Bryobacteraceae bacterium]